MRTLSTAGLVVAVLLLAGCLPQQSPETTPAPEPIPVFASEEEALAAAEDAYAAYEDLTAQILADGGRDGERISAVSTAEFLDASIAGFKKAEDEGWRTVGVTIFRDMTIQAFAPAADVGVIVVYVCEDVSAVDVLDPSGHSLVSPDRPDTTIMQVTFDWSPDRTKLLIANREAWSTQPC